MKIAGCKTTSDWQILKGQLKIGGTPDLWNTAFDDFFFERLQTRYFRPINAIQKIESNKGEGFSIVALQCSLIEFLGATLKGLIYVLEVKDPTLEYKDSKDMFVRFLVEAPPFRETFDQSLAIDFYKGVRCGLVHDARTKLGWRIHKSSVQEIVDKTAKIVYRDNLQNGFISFVDWYRSELREVAKLQEAFIRKFDSLCLE
jgi:hypothetical protein